MTFWFIAAWFLTGALVALITGPALKTYIVPTGR